MPANAEASLLGPPYACGIQKFWVSAAALLLTGGFLGAFAAGYIKAIQLIPQFWYQAGNPNYPQDASTLYWAAGQPWWIAIGVGVGLVTGAVKMATGMDEFPSFLKEMKDQEVDPFMSVRIFGLTLVSMIGGAPLGPEAGIGSAGSLIGQTAAWLVKKLPYSFCKDLDAKEFTLAGAAAALGPLLPSPYIAMLLVGEAVGWPSPRKAALVFLAVMASGGVYGWINPQPYLSSQTLLLAGDISRSQRPYNFAIAILFGIVGSFLALIHFLIGGVARRSFGGLKAKLKAALGQGPSVLITCTISGTLFGLFNYLFPLTLGPGTALLPPVISLASELSPGLLISSTLIKMLSFWTCSSGGLVGGVVFPMLLIGTMMASVASTWTGVSRFLSTTCLFSAVGASFIPLPSFWIFLAFIAFLVDAEALLPICTAVFISHIMFAGVGIPQLLMKLSERRREAKDAPLDKGNHSDANNLHVIQSDNK